jgi:ABC-type spermidine/putrescine transport system permease subunit I
MFDLIFTAISSLVAGSSAPGRQEATTWEEIVWGMATVFFPILDFLLMIRFGPDSSTVLLVMLPVGFALLTTVLSALGGSIFLRTLVSALTCLLFCLAAGFVAAFLNVFTFF